MRNNDVDLIDPIERRRRSFFLMPPSAPVGASLSVRDKHRQAQTNYFFIALAVLSATAAYPVAFATGHPNVLHLLMLSMAVIALFVAIFLNRRMHCRAAGILAVVTVNVALVGSTLSGPRPWSFDVFVLTMFPLFIQSEILAVVMLGWRWVLFIVLCNVLFFLWCMTLPPSREIEAMMQFSLYDISLRIFTNHFFILIAAFRSVFFANEAMLRAERASLLARLRQLEAQTEQVKGEESRQMHVALQLITTFALELEEGKPDPHIPVDELPKPYQQVGTFLNRNWRTREQVRRREDVQSIEQLKQEIQKGEDVFSLTGNDLLDPLIKALNQRYSRQ